MNRQVIQSLRSGEAEVIEAPVPLASARTLLVEVHASVISAGTERMLAEFGRDSLLAKARKNPERVRQVLEKVRTDGVLSATEAVRSRLSQPVAMGYCAAGVVRSVGREVEGFAPGDRVVTNGPHAEVVRIPPTLAARIPAPVSFEAAAFTPLAAIGLHGLRLAAPSLGETVVIYGLGLIGLLTAQIARAAGCRVIGLDLLPARLELGRRFGIETLPVEDPSAWPRCVHHLTGGVGADAVLLTLVSDSPEPLRIAARMSRKRGRIVMVGSAPIAPDRADLYEKELTLQVSCSYGPGRYDPRHEAGALDYPLPYVRWTEGRNFSAVLDLMSDGRLDPLPLVERRLPLQEATRGYAALLERPAPLGIVLQYPSSGGDGSVVERDAALGACPPAARAVSSGRRGMGSNASGVVGFFGAGNFASRVLMPTFAKAGFKLQTVVSPGGNAAALSARRHGFEEAASDPEAVLEDAGIDTVVIATPHGTHADLAAAALRSGKHVFVEKPLALTQAGVCDVAAALDASPDRILCVGFNRRMAPMTLRVRSWLADRREPLALAITVNAGRLATGHWILDPELGGGPLAGEGCHFVDLARHLAASPIRDLRRVPVGSDRQSAFLHLAFEDGSAASIQYLSGGPAGMAKERVEGAWGGRGFRIENWRRLRSWGLPGRPRMSSLRQDKGHEALVRSFHDAVVNGAPEPIPSRELFEVGVLVAELAGDPRSALS